MTKERRYDIDWIRVIAFDILIIYHVGMFFVPWDFELKNNLLIDWIRWPMLFANQWRLSLLFVVSGMGTRYALLHRTPIQFVRERFMRLILPLGTGIIILIAPVVYLVRLSQGLNYSSYIEFFPDFFKGVYPTGNFSWAHLWFIVYLFWMSIIATPIFIYLSKNQNTIIEALKKLAAKHSLILYFPVIPLLVSEILLYDKYPINHAFVFGSHIDWYALVYYFLHFIFGYILISIGKSFWVSLEKIRVIFLIVGLTSFPLLIVSWFYIDLIMVSEILKTLNSWSWILCIFAFSSKFLNKKSRVLQYRVQAVYPYYILHFTVLITLGYLLKDTPIHYGVKLIIMVIGTFGIVGIIYEFIIRRTSILKPFFGIKPTNTKSYLKL